MSGITEQQYKHLKQEVEDAKAESDRAQGARDELLRNLKDEFDCGSAKEAKALLLKLKHQRDEAQQTFEKALTAYEEKWKDDA